MIERADKPSPVGSCRLCGHYPVDEILDLGKIPSIHILTREPKPVPLFPIHLNACPRCGLAQMPASDLPEPVYADSDIYTTLHQPVAYLRDLLDALATFRNLKNGLEVGCNDGRFMAALTDAGFGPMIGVEPNAHTSKAARKRGFDVESAYFNTETAERLVERHGLFDFVVARHVLEHVDRIKEFLAGVHRVLRDDGVFLLELPYVEPGFAAGAPNVLWEEHINYFFEPVLNAMLANAGFRPEMRRYYTGGALVIAILAVRTTRPATESWPGAAAMKPYLLGYADKVRQYHDKLHEVLTAARARGYANMIYGAGFRSATTINTMGVADLIDAVVDDRPDLDGYLMPGTRHHIVPFDRFNSEKPLLLLLGVGAEYEAKVLRRVATRFATVVPLSLVYPGPVLEHCQAAAGKLLFTKETSLDIKSFT